MYMPPSAFPFLDYRHAATIMAQYIYIYMYISVYRRHEQERLRLRHEVHAQSEPTDPTPGSTTTVLA